MLRPPVAEAVLTSSHYAGALCCFSNRLLPRETNQGFCRLRKIVVVLFTKGRRRIGGVGGGGAGHRPNYLLFICSQEELRLSAVNHGVFPISVTFSVELVTLNICIAENNSQDTFSILWPQSGERRLF